MVRAIAALRAQSRHQVRTESYLEDLVASLNEQLCEYNAAQQFLTAFCGVLDLERHSLRYVNAGHNPPLVAAGRETFRYLHDPINPLVGMVPGLTYRAGAIQLEPGSTLLLYTDGVTEAEDVHGRMLGEDRLLNCVHPRHAASAGQIVETVFEEVRAFAAGAEQSDDITMLAVRSRGAG